MKITAPQEPFRSDFINGIGFLTYATKYMEKELGERFRLARRSGQKIASLRMDT